MSNVVEVLTDRDSKQHKLPPPSENMVWIPGGTFLMGSDKHYPEEAPAHRGDRRWLLDGSAHGDQ